VSRLPTPAADVGRDTLRSAADAAWQPEMNYDRSYVSCTTHPATRRDQDYGKAKGGTIVSAVQPIRAYHPIDGISLLRGISRLLTERVPHDRHHGRGADHFLVSFIAVAIGSQLLGAC